jgi:hypothetical protein
MGAVMNRLRAVAAGRDQRTLWNENARLTDEAAAEQFSTRFEQRGAGGAKVLLAFSCN